MFGFCFFCASWIFTSSNFCYGGGGGSEHFLHLNTGYTLTTKFKFNFILQSGPQYNSVAHNWLAIAKDCTTLVYSFLEFCNRAEEINYPFFLSPILCNYTYEFHKGSSQIQIGENHWTTQHFNVSIIKSRAQPGGGGLQPGQSWEKDNKF